MNCFSKKYNDSFFIQIASFLDSILEGQFHRDSWGIALLGDGGG